MQALSLFETRGDEEERKAECQRRRERDRMFYSSGAVAVPVEP